MQKNLNILLIGNGGREHALAWALSRSPLVEKILVVPGNGGTASGLPKVSNVTDVNVNDFEALVAFAQTNGVNFVVPGPEVPLVEGVSSYFRRVGIRCFGPSKAAARMEGSKSFSKDFMKRHNIPTAAYENFTDYEKARKYLDDVKYKVVIKANGLAAGKGVIIPETIEEARTALEEVMLKKEFGSAGDEVVIEELLEGNELSILTFSDGRDIKSLPPAQDHKRIYDGDRGPNTGGMGCYAPADIASATDLKHINDEILQPTIDAMSKEGFPFVGVLFTGLMMTKSGPKVLEYNVRFGDPETQTLLPLLSSESDLAEIMLACTCGRLRWINIKVDPLYAVTVVVAAGGYPGSYSKGSEMQVDSVDPDTTIFHAGTSLVDKKLKTFGGRVIAATAKAATLQEAVKRAYKGVESIRFDGMQYRKDIAHRALDAPPSSQPALSYAASGVSVDTGNQFVEMIKSSVRKTKRPGTDAEIGGFGGIFDLQASGYRESPVLVGAIDGVGTKLKIAQALGKHDTVGIDLVAMNVNDLVVQGAEALMFLDCFSCSKLDPKVAASFVTGLAEGCIQAGCALIGGETAEMPGMYQGGEYDVVGAAIGATQRDEILPKTDQMVAGDVLIGLASSGVHSNGFSLVRKILETKGLSYQDPAPWDPSTSVGLSLLTPTRIYAKQLHAITKKKLVKGMAHITGGGLTDNVPRMLPRSKSHPATKEKTEDKYHLSAELDPNKWPLLPVMKWLREAGNMTWSEFARTFNTGIGMVMVVSKENLHSVRTQLESAGETVYEIGQLVEGDLRGPCLIKGWSEN